MSVDDAVLGEEITVQETTVQETGTDPAPAAPGAGHQPRSGAPEPPRTPDRPARLVVGWVLCALAAVVVVLYGLSPLFAQRDQHKLLSSYRAAVRNSSLQATGLFGVTLPDEPPSAGSAVGILDIGRIHLQQVVTEGVGPGQTEKGPGHVPGTAGLGQPGNAAVVGRHTAFGGAFAHLGSLHVGDPIVVTTTEGQSLYVVTQVRDVRIHPGSTAPTASLGLGTRVSTVTPTAPARLGPSVGVDDLYGVSTTNRLTLVTSASDLPWNTSSATVVLATMRTKPFTPTPQESRSTSEEGRSGAPGAWAPLVLALQAFALAAIGAVVLYRRTPLRTAYLVSTAPLVVTAVLLALAVGHMLPAWT